MGRNMIKKEFLISTLIIFLLIIVLLIPFTHGISDEESLENNDIVLYSHMDEIFGRDIYSINAGYEDTCAIFFDSSSGDPSLQCWGISSNGFGLTDGTDENSNDWYEGHPWVTDEEITQIVGDTLTHRCALVESGTVYCWGNNRQGQLGHGDWNDNSAGLNRLSELREVNFPVETVVSSIDVGSMHSCAIVENGSVYCWGGNFAGQLGDGNHGTNSTNPILVDLGEGNIATSISTGSTHTCALIINGDVRCWGSNRNGEIGNGSNNSESNDYVHTYQTGSPAWGLHTIEAWTMPTTVDLNGSSAISISSGHYNTCAILIDGEIMCWGAQIGTPVGSYSFDGTAYNLNPYFNSYPTLVVNNISGDSKPVNIEIGGSNACVIIENNHNVASFEAIHLQCWGDNSYGQIVGIDQPYVSEPTTIELDNNVEVLAVSVSNAISSGSYLPNNVIGLSQNDLWEKGHICVILIGGSIECWGSNNYGQLGDGTNIDKDGPTPVLMGNMENLVKMVSGELSCALYDLGSVECWGTDTTQLNWDGTTSNSDNYQTRQFNLDLPAIDIDGGGHSMCAILENYSVVCWGDNRAGQLGDGSSVKWSNDSVYVSLPVGRTATSISVSQEGACAVLDNNSLVCWGGNWNGQLGDGTYTNSNQPVFVNSWGFFDNSEVEITKVSKGTSHTCATYIGFNETITGSGTYGDNFLACWGQGFYGQLGNGLTMHGEGSSNPGFNGSSTPVLGVNWGQEHDLWLSTSGINDIAMSHSSTCVSQSDSTDILCWGYNALGNLGDGVSCGDQFGDETYAPGCDDNFAKPYAVFVDWNGRNINPVISMDAGGHHVCVITEGTNPSGSLRANLEGLYCWGRNYEGQSDPFDLSQSGKLILKPPEDPIQFPLQNYSVKSVSVSPYKTCAQIQRELNGANSEIWCFGSLYSTPTRIERSSAYTAIKISDLDGDGVIDLEDQCQGHDDFLDIDGDGLADGCDPEVDIDGDGFSNEDDAFPENPLEWSDSDNDGVGDNSDCKPNNPEFTIDTDNDGICDGEDEFPNDIGEWSDSDNDGVGDNSDKCPGYNDGIDIDLDGVIDGCDSFIDEDLDGDGVFSMFDLCPGTEMNTLIDVDVNGCNSFQIDSDNDGIFDAFDECIGFDDTIDNDSDGVSDFCDDIIDSDFDEIADSQDVCEGYPDNIDLDNDNIPDGCDDIVDSDGDGISDEMDVCYGHDDSIDIDNDNLADGCDSLIDNDNDGIKDSMDLCNGHNDNTDLDQDGIPDGCDKWFLTQSTKGHALNIIIINVIILFLYVFIFPKRLH